MPKFCSKCGKELKPGAQFCPGCGATTKKGIASAARPPQAAGVSAAPVAPPPKKSGCGWGCAIGCLAVVLIILLLVGGVIGAGYYFLFMREKEPGSYFEVDKKSGPTVKCDSPACLEDNLKKCSPAKGETEFGDFADVQFEILGQSGSDCVVFAEIIELKELPSQLEAVPDFILDNLLKNLTLECLIPQKVYSEGTEKVGNYISENLYSACKGPLFDLMDKFGVEIETE